MPIGWVALAVSVLSAAYSITQAKKQKEAARKAADARRGYEMPIEGEATNLALCYGKVKIGGARVYHNSSGSFVYTSPNSNKIFMTGMVAGTEIVQRLRFNTLVIVMNSSSNQLTSSMTGNKNEFLYIQQALCQGAINGAYDVIIDESRTLDDPSLGTDIYKKSVNKIEAALRIDVHYGGTPTADAVISANFGERGRATFDNIAYASAVVRLDRVNPQFSGTPVFQFLIEGRLIRSVIQSLTDPGGYQLGTDGKYYGLNPTFAYSNNPALVLLDYLLDTISGKSMSLSEIDLESFYKSAAICDITDLVETSPGVYGPFNVVTAGKIYKPTDGSRNITNRNLPLYECNLIIDTKKSIRENVETILATMGDARLVWIGGKYKLNLQYPRTNDDIILAATLTDAELILDQDVEISWPSTSDRLNHCIVKFNNEAEDFKEDTASWPPKLDPNVLTPESNPEVYYLGLGAKRYTPGVSGNGWDDKHAGSRLLNNYAVWNTNDFSTVLEYKFVIEKENQSPTSVIEYTADDNMAFELVEITDLDPYTESAPIHTFASTAVSNWKNKFTKTFNSGDGTADKIFRLTITANDTSGETSNDDGSITAGRGAALRILKGNFIVWSTREPAYSTFIRKEVNNELYRTWLEEDSGLELEREIYAEGISDYYHALAKAEETVRTSRGTFSLKLKYRLTDRIIEPGEIIRVNSTALKLGDASPLYFKVDGVNIDENFVCELLLSRFDSSFLAWNVDDNEDQKPPPVYNFVIRAPSYLIFTSNTINTSSGRLIWNHVKEPGFLYYALYVHTIADAQAGLVDADGYPIFTEIGRTTEDFFDLPNLGVTSAIFGIRVFTVNGVSLMVMSNPTTTVVGGYITEITYDGSTLQTVNTGGEVLGPIPDPNFIKATDKTYWTWDGDPGPFTIYNTGGVTGGRLVINCDSGYSIIYSNRSPIYEGVTGDSFLLTLRFRVLQHPGVYGSLTASCLTVEQTWPSGATVPGANDLIVPDLLALTLNEWYEYTSIVTMQNNPKNTAQLPCVLFVLNVFAGGPGIIEVDTFDAIRTVGTASSGGSGTVLIPDDNTGAVFLDDGTWGYPEKTYSLPHNYTIESDAGMMEVDQAWDQTLDDINKSPVEVLAKAENTFTEYRKKFELSRVGGVTLVTTDTPYGTKALYFPGVNFRTDYYKILRGTQTLAFKNPTTFEYLIKPVDRNFPYAIAGIEADSTVNLNVAVGNFLLYIDLDGRLKALIKNINNVISTGLVIGPEVPVNEWSHVVMEWTFEGEIRLSVNGMTDTEPFNTVLTLKAETPSTSQWFGTATVVARNANVLATGNSTGSSLFIRTGVDFANQQLINTGFVQNGAAEGTLNIAISDDGSVIAIAHPAGNNAAYDAGIVKVYSGVGYATVTTLSTPTTANQKWGEGLAISGDGTKIFVGAPGANTLAGRIAVFSGTNWADITYLEPPASTLSLGHTLAISNDGSKIVAGTLSNKVVVYSGTTWATVAEIAAPDSNTAFGHSVIKMNAAGDIIFVGDNSFILNGQNSGIIYTFSGASWATISRIYGNSEYEYIGRNFDISANGSVIYVLAKNEVSSGFYTIRRYESNNLVASHNTPLNLSNYGLWMDITINANGDEIYISNQYDDTTLTDSGAIYKITYALPFASAYDLLTGKRIGPYYQKYYYSGTTALPKTLGMSGYDMTIGSGSSKWNLESTITSTVTNEEIILNPSILAEPQAQFGSYVVVSDDNSTMVIASNNSQKMYIYRNNTITVKNIRDVIIAAYPGETDFPSYLSGIPRNIDLSSNGDIIVLTTALSPFWVQGAAFAFSGANWDTITYLEPLGGNYNIFDISISSDGSTIVFGPDGYYLQNVLKNQGGNWAIETQLAPDAGSFGIPVTYPSTSSGWRPLDTTADGMIVVVGASNAGYNTYSGCGAVNIFSGGFGAVNVLIPPPSDLYLNTAFGTNVEITSDASTLAISAPYIRANGASVGAVYIIKNPSDWLEVDLASSPYIKLTRNTSGEKFGLKIALSNNGKVLFTMGGYTTRTLSYFYGNNFNNVVTKNISKYISGFLADLSFEEFFLDTNSDGSKLYIGFQDDASQLISGNQHGSVRVLTPFVNEKQISIFSPKRMEETSASYNFGSFIKVTPDKSIMVVATQSPAKLFIFSGNNYETVVEKTLEGTISALDISDDCSKIIVGMKTLANPTYQSGKVVILSGSGWATSTELPTPDDNDGQWGFSVALSGDGTKAAVSSVPGGSGTGSVIVFETLTYTALATLTPPTVSNLVTTNGKFGYSLDLDEDGSHLVVGSIAAEYNSNANSGFAWVFHGTNFVNSTPIYPANPQDQAKFGSDVKISADSSVIAIGAPNATNGAYANSGDIYLHYGTNWAITRTFSGPSIANAYFGTAIAISNNFSYNVTTGNFTGCFWGSTSSSVEKILNYYGENLVNLDLYNFSDFAPSEGGGTIKAQATEWWKAGGTVPEISTNIDGTVAFVGFNNDSRLHNASTGSIGIYDTTATDDVEVISSNLSNIKDFRGYLEEFRYSGFPRYTPENYDTPYEEIPTASMPTDKDTSKILTKDNIFREVLNQPVHMFGGYSFETEPYKVIWDRHIAGQKDEFYQGRGTAYVVLSSKDGQLRDYGQWSFNQGYYSPPAVVAPWDDDTRPRWGTFLYSSTNDSGMKLPPKPFFHNQKVWGRDYPYTVPSSPTSANTSTDFISVSGFSVNFSQPFTIEAWVYLYEFTHSSSRQQVIAGMSSTRQVSSEAFSLVMESNRTLTFRFDCAGIIKTASYLDFTQYEQWVHIAITRDANQVTTIYVNGVAGSVTATDSGSWALAGVQTFWGGGYRASNYYYAMRGYIASIRCTINTDGVPNYTGNFTPIQADFETPPQDTFDFLNTDNFRWSYIYDIIGRLEFTGESGRRWNTFPTDKWYDVGGITLSNNALISFYGLDRVSTAGGGYGTALQIGELRASDYAPIYYLGFQDVVNNPNNSIFKFSYATSKGNTETEYFDFRIDGLWYNNSGTWEKVGSSEAFDTSGLDVETSLNKSTDSILFNDAGSGLNKRILLKDLHGSRILINNQPLDVYTIAIADEYIRCTSSSSTTVRIPNDSLIDFSIGTNILVRQAGAGQVTIEGYPGVLLNAPKGSKTKDFGSTINLIKVGPNEWDILSYGELDNSSRSYTEFVELSETVNIQFNTDKTENITINDEITLRMNGSPVGAEFVKLEDNSFFLMEDGSAFKLEQ